MLLGSRYRPGQRIGIDLRHRLKAAGILLPVIYITANDSPAVRLAAIESRLHCLSYKALPGEVPDRADRKGSLRGGIGCRTSPTHHSSIFCSNVCVGTPWRTVANWLIGNAVVTAKTLSVRMVIRGQPNKQIAWAIACIERTVKAHRHNVIEKIQVKTLAEVVSAAARVGIASATKQTE